MIIDQEKKMEEGNIEGELMESLDKRLRIIYQKNKKGFLLRDLEYDDILHEVLRQSHRVVKEKLNDCDCNNIYNVFQSEFKLYHAASISMMFLYAVLSVRMKISFETFCLLKEIEKKYRQRPVMKDIQDCLAILKEQLNGYSLLDYQLLMGLKGHSNPTINLFVRNDFSGEIKDLHVAHADVAVGVAEKGSNVYHHKTDSHE